MNYPALRNISVTNDYGYIPFVVFTIRFFPLFFITGVVTRVTRIAACGAGIAYTSEAPELTPSFSVVRVVQSLIFYVVFVDHCLSFCPFNFAYSICHSFLCLPILCLQTFFQ
jgi:hypothetical protein